MRIDRGRFFLLTSAIGAGACPTPVTPRGEPPPSPITKASSAASDEVKAEARWTPDSEWWAEPYDPEYCLGQPGGSWTAPTICGAPSTGACLTVGHSAACDMKPHDTCTATLAKACDRALDRLSGAVASIAAECLASSDWLCNGQGAEFAAARCMIVATDRACADPSVVATCAALTSTCKNPWWPSGRCEQLLSGLSPSGREHVRACMLGSKCTVGPAECLALR
jgi:hypothetical protein